MAFEQLPSVKDLMPCPACREVVFLIGAMSRGTFWILFDRIAEGGLEVPGNH